MDKITQSNAEEHHEVFHRPEAMSEPTFNEAVRISADTVFTLSHDSKLSTQEVGIITKHAADIARFKQERAQG